MGDVLLELGEPQTRVAVGGGWPVAAWRKIATGDDLGAVRHRRSLELADLEKAIEEHPEPFLDFANCVRVPCFLRKVRRPRAAISLPPRVPRQKRDLGGPQP